MSAKIFFEVMGSIVAIVLLIEAALKYRAWRDRRDNHIPRGSK
jgi:hypothetical protein